MYSRLITPPVKKSFFLFGPRGLLAFEIKRTARATTPMRNGLKAFLRDYPSARAHFVYLGTRHMQEGGIDIIPAGKILKDLPQLLSGKQLSS